jgi:drug/metabolite transporter (DMT)-like permease
MAAFAMAVTLGGGNFLAVRFSNQELAPTWGAALRFGAAAVLFIAIVSVLRLRWPRGRVLALNVGFGLLSTAIFYALMYWALVRVTAGVATVVMAIVPLVTLLLAAAQRTERLRGRALIGSLLAFGGIGWMMVGPNEVVLPLAPLLVMLAAAVAVGESVIIGKKLSANHPAMTNAVAITSGAIVLLAMSALNGDRWILPRDPQVAWSVLYLVTLGSVGLFVLILLVVRHWTASATSYMFVLFPIVTMLLEAWLADEVITLQGVTGAALVMSGVWFGALSPGARRPLVEKAPDLDRAVLEAG